MASESERNTEQYLQGVAFPASKEDLIYAAESNDAPQHFIEHLEGLREGAEFRDANEVMEAESYEEQATEQRES